MNIRKLVTITVTVLISLITLQAFGVYLSPTTPDLLENINYNYNLSLSNQPIKIDRGQVYFEKNIGQNPDQIAFTSYTPNYKLSLKQDSAVLQLIPHSKNKKPDEYWQLNIQPYNASRNSSIKGEGKLTSTSSYFTSQDESNWFKGVPHYKSVSYKDIYPGIDLKYYGTKQNIEYDFIVRAGHNAEIIEIAYDGIDNISLDNMGNAILNFKNHHLVQKKPVAYQVIKGKKHIVQADYELRVHKDDHARVNLAFKIASWDKSHDLIIDPVIAYSAQMGGDLFDAGGDITVDKFGHAYTVSHTFSSNELEAQAGLFNCENNCQSDIVISKFSADGSEVLWSVLLSGSNDEDGLGIEVDAQGNTYAAGWTDSPDFPTVNAIDDTLDGLSDGFLTKISSTGTELLFSTYFGSEGSEVITDIAKGDGGDIYVSGRSSSSNADTENTRNDPQVIETDGFISQFSADGSELHFTKYIGGSRYDSIDAIAIGNNNNVFLTGTTNSDDFPTLSPLYNSLQGVSDAFLMKLTGSGEIMFSTYLGGTLAESAKDIDLDKDKNPVITGVSTSDDYPLQNPLYPEAAGTINDWDSFLTKFSNDGSQLLFSTYVGGNQGDYVSSLVLDNNNNIYISGYTLSENFPVHDALNPTLNGRSDLFISKFSATGDELLYSTYFGGSGDESHSNIAIDSAGSLYLTGLTYSNDFLTTNSANFMKNSTGGKGDAFISKITDFVELDLENQKWYLLSLPYIPATGSTVADIFGDDILTTYGSNWFLFKFNTSTGRYIKLELSDELNHGIAYWIKQSSGSEVTVDVPQNSSGPVLLTGALCGLGKECYLQAIIKSAATNQYHFIGNPFSSPILWSDIRFIVDEGPCSIDRGCSLQEAEDLDLIESYGRSYFNGTSAFLTDGSILNAWQGFYIRSFSDAFEQNPRLIFTY